MFKVGDRVICIDSSGRVPKGLRRGKEYCIRDLTTSPCCNVLLLDIGMDENCFIKCSSCGHIYDANIIWFRSSRFRKIEPRTEKHTFTNEVTKELAKEVEVQQPDYAPQELETEVEKTNMNTWKAINL